LSSFLTFLHAGAQVGALLGSSSLPLTVVALVAMKLDDAVVYGYNF